MFLVKSHVPSPTVSVSDEYELDPGGERLSAGAMATRSPGSGLEKELGGERKDPRAVQQSMN